LGAVQVKGGSVHIYSGDMYKKHPICFGVSAKEDAKEKPSRTYVIEADTPENRGEWVTALKEVCGVKTEDELVLPDDVKSPTRPGSIVEGELIKLGNRTKNWNRRYFVLTQKSIQYFKNRAETGMIGEVDISRGAILALEKDGVYTFPNAFSVSSLTTDPKTGGRIKHVIAATSSEERDQWLEEIREVIQQNLAEAAKEKKDNTKR